MKRKKLGEKYLETAQGQEMMIDETLMNIRSAKNDAAVMEALTAGQQVIDDLRTKCNVENFEEMVEKQQENDDEMAQLNQLMEEQGIAEDDVLDELEKLEADMAEEEMGDQQVPSSDIAVQEQAIKEKQKREEVLA